MMILVKKIILAIAMQLKSINKSMKHLDDVHQYVLQQSEEIQVANKTNI